eukprot:m.131336 g.131336  ORF g.131336 m.131336 type:complete len:155 (+) comp11310_c0_seq2:95-559(+)
MSQPAQAARRPGDARRVVPRGSATMTITTTEAPVDPQGGEHVVEVVLREPESTGEAAGTAPQRPTPHIQWAEGTIDNEHLGKKSSKCCCIYHKPRAFGESSDESDYESDDDRGGARAAKKKDKHHDHEDGSSCPVHQHGKGGSGRGNIYSGGPR